MELDKTHWFLKRKSLLTQYNNFQFKPKKWRCFILMKQIKSWYFEQSFWPPRLGKWLLGWNDLGSSSVILAQEIGLYRSFLLLGILTAIPNKSSPGKINDWESSVTHTAHDKKRVNCSTIYWVQVLLDWPGLERATGSSSLELSRRINLEGWVSSNGNKLL